MNITKAYKYQRRKKKAALPLLPGDKALLKELQAEREGRKLDPERLERTGQADLPWQVNTAAVASPLAVPAHLRTGPVRTPALPPFDLDAALARVAEHTFHALPERGVQRDAVAAVLNFRARVPPLATVAQLNGIYPASTTAVERAINAARRAGTVRLLTVNVPGANDLVVSAEAFYAAMGGGERRADGSGDGGLDNRPDVAAPLDALDAELAAFLRARPEATWFSRDELTAAGFGPRLAEIVARGHLALDPSRPGVHTVTTPMQGAFVKLVLAARKWLLKALATNKWSELPETVLLERFAGSAYYWRDYKGVELEWVLYDAVGAGFVEGFGTPVGRGWKVLRTR